MRQLKITKSFTNRESATLEKYLQEIGRFDLIGADEEAELAIRVRNGDKTAFEKLTNSNLRFVVSVAKQYQNQGLSLPDLINEGNMGLMKAVQRFDETRGFKLISYAVWWIRQSIVYAIAEQSRIIRLPSNQLGIMNKIRKETSKQEQLLDREPSNEELSEILEYTIDTIEDAQRNSSRHSSIDAPLVSGEDVSLMDFIINEDAPHTDVLLMQESLTREIERSLATLQPKESTIVKMFFGIGISHPWTLEEIGEKYDLTRERVRQIKEKAIRSLRHNSKSRLLKTYLG